MKQISLTLFGVLLGIWDSYVARALWNWFAVGLGGAHLSMLQAFGLYTLAASVMLWQMRIPKKRDDNPDLYAFAGGLAKAITAALFLLEGYVAHRLMVG